jgi:cell division protease FtsH
VSYTREDLIGKIKVALGGRVAEEIRYSTITTGAESDIERVTAIARQMVGRWGMSEAIGFVTVVPAEARGPFITGSGETSEATQQVVDEQGRDLVDTAHQDVTAVVAAHRDQLEALAQALLKDETLDESDAYAAPGIPGRPVDSPQMTAGAANGRSHHTPPPSNGRRVTVD